MEFLTEMKKSIITSKDYNLAAETQAIEILEEYLLNKGQSYVEIPKSIKDEILIKFGIINDYD